MKFNFIVRTNYKMDDIASTVQVSNVHLFDISLIGSFHWQNNNSPLRIDKTAEKHSIPNSPNTQLLFGFSIE